MKIFSLDAARGAAPPHFLAWKCLKGFRRGLQKGFIKRFIEEFMEEFIERLVEGLPE